MILHNTKEKDWIKLLILIALSVGIMIISVIIGSAIFFLTKNTLLLQAISSIIMFGGIAYCYYLLYEKQDFLKHTFAHLPKLKDIISAIIILVVSIPAIGFISSNDESYNDIIAKMIDYHTLLGLFEAIIVMALIPAIIEEWLFRGVVQRLFIRMAKNYVIGIIMAAAIFSLIHFDMSNFFSRFLMGAILGLIYYYSGNIWNNIIFHFLNNTMAVITMWIDLRNEITDIDYIDTLPVYLAIISFVLIVLWIVYSERVYRLSKKEIDNTDEQKKSFVEENEYN